jgi:hypothetical protein
MSTERDAGTGQRCGTQPGDAGRLGSESGELLIPIASAMKQELLRGTYIQADETPGRRADA